jgi:hypothetical protein
LNDNAYMLTASEATFNVAAENLAYSSEQYTPKALTPLIRLRLVGSVIGHVVDDVADQLVCNT